MACLPNSPFPVASYELSVGPDKHIVLLPAHLALIQVSQGTILVSQAGRGVAVQAGECVLLQAAVPIQVSHSQNHSTSISCVEFGGVEEKAFVPTHSYPVLLNMVNTNRVALLMKTIRGYHGEMAGAAGNTYELQLTTTELVLLTLSALRTRHDDSAVESTHTELKQIEAYCLDHLDEKIIIEDLERLLRMSRSGVFRIIREVCGLTPMAYVRQLRLSQSLKLLQGTALSIANIAEQCGFSSQFHFSRRFKKQYSVTPSVYRKNRGGLRQGKADVYFSQANYAEAAREYVKQVPFIPQTDNDIEAVYRLGFCYYHMAEFEKALETWQPIRDSIFLGKITYCRIDILFRLDRLADALALFEQRYHSSSEHEQAELHTLWKTWADRYFLQRKRRPVDALLDMRKKLFPSNPATLHAATEYSLLIGRGLEGPPDNPSFFSAQRAAALYEELLKSPYAARGDKALALLHMGRYQAVIDEYEDVGIHYAEALCELGRVDECLSRFADNSREYTLALIYAGRYDEILNNPNSDVGLCNLALLTNNNPEEILKRLRGYHWYTTPILLLMGRTWEALEADPDNLHLYGRARIIIEALQALLKGRAGDAVVHLESLEPIDSPDYFPDFLELVSTIVLGFIKDPAGMRKTLRFVVDKMKHRCEAQRNWYAARMILGEIDEATFLSQPYQWVKPVLSLPLFQAIRDDLAGRTEGAIENYKIIHSRYARNMLLICDYTCWHWFITWRLQELGSGR